MKQVVLTQDTSTVLIDNVSKKSGYVMIGNKGDYVLGRDTEGKFIWVRVTPGKTTKPVNAYGTIRDAIEDKIEKGYDVYEYTTLQCD